MTEPIKICTVASAGVRMQNYRCMPWHLSELWKTSFSSATGLGQLFDIIFNTAIFGWARPVFLGYQTMRK